MIDLWPEGVKQSAPPEPLRGAQVILSYKIRLKIALGVYQWSASPKYLQCGKHEMSSSTED